MCLSWDRFSSTWCYMLILAGPEKVDVIFAESRCLILDAHATRRSVYRAFRGRASPPG